VYTQVARAVQYSKLKEFYEPEGNRTVSLAEAFYMATLQSGNLFGKVGSLAPGYDFDALLIDGLDDPARHLSPVQTLERFCYIGNSANIKARWLSGRLIEKEKETVTPVSSGFLKSV
jgi:guanine deaminase